MKEIPEKKGLNLYRLSENCHFKLALESYVFRNTHNYRDSETSEPEFNSRHGLAPLSPFLASALTEPIFGKEALGQNAGKNDNKMFFFYSHTACLLLTNNTSKNRLKNKKWKVLVSIQTLRMCLVMLVKEKVRP